MKKLYSNNNTSETMISPLNDLIKSKYKWNKEYSNNTNSIDNSNFTHMKTSLYNDSKISSKYKKSPSGFSKNKKFKNKSTNNYNNEIILQNGKKDDNYSNKKIFNIKYKILNIFIYFFINIYNLFIYFIFLSNK